jgi:hypothetical protein
MATTVDARREKPRSSIATKSREPRFMALMIARLELFNGEWKGRLCGRVIWWLFRNGRRLLSAALGQPKVRHVARRSIVTLIGIGLTAPVIRRCTITTTRLCGTEPSTPHHASKLQ